MALFNAASMILDSPAGPSGPAGSPVGPSPFGLDAANLLRGMHAVAEPENNEALSNDLRRLSQALSQDDDEEEAKAAGNNGGVSRKDKSLGLLCDNFVKLFAAGDATGIELEAVADKLGVGRRRIYDIVNVLESLDVVSKDRSSSYTWLGISELPACIRRMQAAPPVVPLLSDDPANDAAWNAAGPTSMAPVALDGRRSSSFGGGGGPPEGRKEKSIRELATKFVSLFLQAHARPACDSTMSLDQAARSLLKFESGLGPNGPEPDPGAMKTKVRRLYDICNVLSSLKMLVKVRLPDTSKPAFRWLGVTKETYVVFDPAHAAVREVKAYGGGANLPVISNAKRKSNNGMGGQALKRQASQEVGMMMTGPPMSSDDYLPLPMPTEYTRINIVGEGAPVNPPRPPLPLPLPSATLPLPPPSSASHLPMAASAMPHHPTAQHKSGLPYSRLSGGTGGGNRSSFGGVLPKQPMACTPMTTTTSALPPFAAATMASATSVPKAPPLGTLSPASQQLTAGRQPEGLTSGLPLKKSVAVLPTPAHVQAVMMAHDNENNEAPLDNTPRQATSALLTLMMGLEDEGGAGVCGAPPPPIATAAPIMEEAEEEEVEDEECQPCSFLTIPSDVDAPMMLAPAVPSVEV